MFNDFLMFVAPGLTIIAAIILAFVVAKYDDAVRDDD
jgi:hypothetical protein